MPTRTTTPKIEREREVQRTLRRLKGKLLAFSRKSLDDVFEMGDLLNDAAALLKGGFGTWVAQECGIDPRTAFNYRRVATRLASHRSDLLARSISPTVAIHLGAASCAAIESVLDRARTGLPVTVEFVKQLIRKERSLDPGNNELAAAVEVLRRDARAHLARMTSEFLSELEAHLSAPKHPTTIALRTAATTTLLEGLEALIGPEAAASSKVAALIRGSLGTRPASLENSGGEQIPTLRVLEICAGAGGAALGFEAAGYEHVGLIDKDGHCCETLRLNRPSWPVLHTAVEELNRETLPEFDVLSGGVPCQPFSVQGNRAGRDDPRDLFPEVLRLTRETRPRALVIENVLGLSEAVHDGYRRWTSGRLEKLGYTPFWGEIDAQAFGVPQRRRRLLLVAFQSKEAAAAFRWPLGNGKPRVTVGDALLPMMNANGWQDAAGWSSAADGVAPTLIGAGRKIGIDLGSQTGREAFRKLGVDPGYIARDAPAPDFTGAPRLTLAMLARLQDFPDGWRFSGRSRDVFSQIANAFPRAAASAIAEAVSAALFSERGQARPLTERRHVAQRSSALRAKSA